METVRRAASWVLLTGATGFVGQCLLSELLERRHRVLAVVRAAEPVGARARLAAAMRPWGTDIEAHLESGQLAVLRGDLQSPYLGMSPETLKQLRGSVRSLVHAAGSTTFRSRRDGDPARTNIEGTRTVWQFARDCECLDWHLISTAYVCGQCAFSSEQPLLIPPVFRNDYEQSKWLAEVESTRSAAEAGATLTVYRPSVVVGHSRSGVATRFAGAYHLFRATSLVAHAVAQDAAIDRRRIPLRIFADPGAGANLVFADDLARDFADLFDCRAARGGIYHLTHPAPPDNQKIKSALESYYHISGGRFVGSSEHVPAEDRTPFEDIFSCMTEGIAGYLFESPEFDRRRADAFVSRPAAAWTEARLHRLLRYAESVGWRAGRHDHDPHPELDGFAAYFERFLPSNLRGSTISRIARLSVAVRFRIDEGVDGDWWCRFLNGELVDVCRANGRPADVTFRTTPIAFWRAVAGQVTGAELFLSGDARVEGDIERGLKFAMILQEFVREFPCQRENLLARAMPTA